MLDDTARERIRSAVHLIRMVLATAEDEVDAHTLKRVLNHLIWTVTEAGGKFAPAARRFWTPAARERLQFGVSGLQHEHVYERKHIVQELLQLRGRAGGEEIRSLVKKKMIAVSSPRKSTCR
jgi:hypothetical protein